MGVNLLCIEQLVKQGLELYLIDRFKGYTEDNRMGPSDRGLKLMKESKIIVINQDFWLSPKLPFESEFFDVVTVLDVIEHLPGHPLQLFGEIRRVLKGDGKIIVSGPNSASLMKRVKLLLGKHP